MYTDSDIDAIADDIKREQKVCALFKHHVIQM